MGLTTGTSPRTYSPNRVGSRAETVTFLWRFAGSPPPEIPVVVADCSTTFTAIGDSVMQGAVLAGTLGPNSFAGWEGVVDASVCRHAVSNVIDACGASFVPSALTTILTAVANGTLGDVVVLHVGTNGVFSAADFDELVVAAAPARVAWFITVQNNRHWEEAVNQIITDGVSRWRDQRQVEIIDWRSVSDSTPGLLKPGGVHLTPAGAQSFADLIQNALDVS